MINDNCRRKIKQNFVSIGNIAISLTDIDQVGKDTVQIHDGKGTTIAGPGNMSLLSYIHV